MGRLRRRSQNKLTAIGFAVRDSALAAVRAGPLVRDAQGLGSMLRGVSVAVPALLVSAFDKPDGLMEMEPDCAAPQSIHEVGVCSDPDLQAIDVDVREAFERYIRKTSQPEEAVHVQNEWFGGVIACEGEKGCLEPIYRARLAELKRRLGE